MKIALSGVQGSGKTTLINRMKDMNIFGGYKFYGSISAELSKKNIKINKEGDNTTQLLVMNGHFNRLFAENNIVVDRCLLDGLAYTFYNYDVSQTVDNWVYAYALTMTREYINKYDVIFYLNDEVPLDDDGTRSNDVQFRKDIVNCFEIFIKLLIPFTNIIPLNGSVEERVEQMVSYLNNYK